jgi:hypothetical protein
MISNVQTTPMFGGESAAEPNPHGATSARRLVAGRDGQPVRGPDELDTVDHEYSGRDAEDHHKCEASR